jgi:DNA-binding transcriptional regulator YbjK
VTGVRAEASRQVREAIVAATVRVVARDGVGAVTHRVVASEAKVSLSSTTWHFATKADILEAALHWTARREVGRIARIADRLSGSPFDLGVWADELAAWIIEQVTSDRDLTVALYRLQAELLGTAGAPELHREWNDGLREVGERVLPIGEAEMRLIIAALDGLRMSALNDDEHGWLRPAVYRQLNALLG